MKTPLYKWAIIFSILLPLFPLLLAQPLLFEQTYGYQGGELFDFTIRNNTLYAISLDGVIQSEDAGNNWQLVLDLVRRLKKDIITATSEIPPSHLLKIFPNPAKDLLQFSSLQSGTVLDLMARKLTAKANGAD